LLISDDWLALTSDLGHHFGTNAEVIPQRLEEIRNFLKRNGATDRRKYASPEEGLPRISTLPWFMEKHQGAIRVVVKGRVKSLTSCTDCHKGSEVDSMNSGKD
jgi:hypothetical protein